MYPTIGYLGATALALADLIRSALSKDRNMTFTLLNRLAIGLASVRRALDAGPGNTNGQPLSVAGHLVFGTCDKTQVQHSR